MQAKFNVQGKERKALVNALSELTLEKAVYKGVPSCAYELGSLTVDRNGTLLAGEEVNSTAFAKLVEELQARGLTAELDEPLETAEAETDSLEPVGLTVALPKDGFTPETWANLNNLLTAKGVLIQKALGLKELPEVIEEDDRITFPWFSLSPSSSQEAEAYSRFVCALCTMAKSQKRITAKSHPVDNEKYAFRCFLLRLGFIGAEYKDVRKVLLKNLTGNTAFKEEVRHANA